MDRGGAAEALAASGAERKNTHSCRLAPADIGPAAFLTYEGAQGEHVGFLVTRAPGEVALRIAQGRGTSAALWSTGGMGYAVTGAGERQRLLAIGESIRKRLTSP